MARKPAPIKTIKENTPKVRSEVDSSVLSTKSAKLKVFYTQENINTFLLEYNTENNSTQLFGMVAYLFKTYQDNPTEFLSKIKL